MAEYDETKKTSLSEIEEQEKYLVHNKGEISRVLLSLSKKPDIITAYFKGGSHYVLTAVLTVLPDRDLVVMDVGPDPLQNRLLLEEGRMTCVTAHDRIKIRFSLDNVQSARFQGQSALAAAIPQSLFRLQRREFYRVHVPMMKPARCLYYHPELGELDFEVVDISAGGLGLLNRHPGFEAEQYAMLGECTLVLPEFGELEVDMQIRNSFPIEQRDGSTVTRIGCAFEEMNMRQNTIIQRYIHRVQIDEKARDNGNE